SEGASGLEALMAQQVQQAIAESDIVIFLVDARSGVTPGDEAIANHLRRCNKLLFVAVNKVDGLQEEVATSDFHALGLGQPIPIAASHGRGVNKMMADILATLPEDGTGDETEAVGVRIALIGRP